MTSTPKPTEMILLYGAPCASCGRPAEAVRVYLGARVVTHVDHTQQPCRVTGQAGGAS
jgi:hypothetical protein